MSIVSIILPIFALILLGWVIRRWGGLSDGFWVDLERLIYFVFFPALLFHSLSHGSIDLGAATPMVAVGILFTLAGMGLGRLSKNLFRDPPRVYAAAFQCSFRFNSYIGLAVAGALHGKAGIAAIGLLMGFLVPMANLAAVSVLARHGEGRWIKELLGNPLILSTVGGVVFGIAGLSLPAVADATLELPGPGLPALGADRGGRWPAASMRWTTPAATSGTEPGSSSSCCPQSPGGSPGLSDLWGSGATRQS